MSRIKQWCNSIVCFGMLLFVTNAVHAQIDLTLPDVFGEPGDIQQIAITVSDVTEDSVIAYQFEIYFDPDVVSITDVDYSNTITPSSPVVNLIPADYIFVTWAGALPLSGEGTLLYLTIELVDEGYSGLDWQNVGFFTQDNTTQIDVEVNPINGTVAVYNQPEPPGLESPEDGAQNISIDTTLIWEEIYNAYTYNIQVAVDENFSNLVINTVGVADTFLNIEGLNHITEHFWRVQSVNPVGVSGWSTQWKFTTIVDVPASPILISPPDEETGVEISVTLIWEESDYADTYHLQVATDSQFGDLIADVEDLTELSYELNELDNNTNYYWRVRAQNIAGDGGWSEARMFTTIVAAPQQVALAGPEHEAVIGTDTVIFFWYRTQPEITHYELNIAADSDFDTIIYSNDAITDTSYVYTGLADETDYWWRVRAHNAAGAGEYSNVYKFRIVLTHVDWRVAGVPVKYELMQNYPNPFNPSTVIRFGIPEQSRVRVEIYNTIGQLVRVLVNEELTAGYHEVTWYSDIDRSASGIYLYRIEAVSIDDPSNHFIETRKMTFIR